TVASSIVGGTLHSSASAILRMVAHRTLPERVLGSASTIATVFEEGHRPDALADEGDELRGDVFARAVDAGLEHREADRDRAFELVGNADDRAFGDVVVAGDDLFQLAGGEAMAGDVDHVVDPAHPIDVAVLVEIPSVGGQVVARVAREVGLYEPLLALPQVRG